MIRIIVSYYFRYRVFQFRESNGGSEIFVEKFTSRAGSWVFRDNLMQKTVRAYARCRIQRCSQPMYYRKYDIHLLSRSTDFTVATVPSRSKMMEKTTCENLESHVTCVLTTLS